MVRGRRSDLIRAVQEVFEREQDVLMAEIGTIQLLPEAHAIDPEIVAEAKAELAKQVRIYFS